MNTCEVLICFYVSDHYGVAISYCLELRLLNMLNNVSTILLVCKCCMMERNIMEENVFFCGTIPQ